MKNLRNSVTLIGHLGDTPEFKELDNGTTLAKFAIATDESYKNKSGEKVDATEWHNLIVWGAQAKTVRDYLKKGSKVMIEGRLTTETWDNKEGVKQYRSQIVVNDFLMLDKKQS
ncbi:MAG: single-stranded DNA-binding protein [Bacteroidetes bacterium]|nr:MAG: single-stranded DNA-binding protein [Bacteroidota bacterium]